MIKFLFYLVIFYLIGYNYGKLTEGTIFDNFFVLALSIFIFIIVFEWIISSFKKNTNKHDLDGEENESMDEILQDVGKEFDKTWNINYNDNEIQIVNKYNREELHINGKLVSEKERDSWYSWVLPYKTLVGTVKEANVDRKIKVKLGGVLALNCKVYVGKKLIFKEQIKPAIFSKDKV